MKIGCFEDLLREVDLVNEINKNINFFSKKNIFYKNAILKLLCEYNINSINDLKTDQLKSFEKDFYNLIKEIKRDMREMAEIILENQYSIY